MPKSISIEAVQTGMIVGRNVNDTRGNLLVQIGTTLNDQIIDILKRRGIQEIIVSTAEDEERRRVTEEFERASLSARRDAKLGKRATEKLSTVLDDIDRLFAGLADDEIMTPLHTATVNFWRRKAQEAEQPQQETEQSSQETV